jgi:hypothetical protein
MQNGFDSGGWTLTYWPKNCDTPEFELKKSRRKFSAIPWLAAKVEEVNCGQIA